MATRAILGPVAALRPSVYSTSQLLFRRSITQTRSVGLKESIKEPDPEFWEQHKRDLLEKVKSGKAHWKPELASDSEEDVKADRGELDASEAAMKDLQDSTKGSAEERSKQRSS